MTEESAFLRAVCDAPEDDLPRLVYADWLDEHGVIKSCRACSGKGSGVVYSPPGRGKSHVGSCINCLGSGRLSDGRPERAEFIRVQCELAVGCQCEREVVGIADEGPDPDPCGGRCAGCRKYDTLRRRERELEGRWGHRWAAAALSPLPTTMFQPYRFRRGFVESITCPARTFLEHCHDVRNACPLREATLTGDVDPDWFRGFVMRGGVRQGEGVRLCEGEAELGIVERVYRRYGNLNDRSSWGRKLFLDLLHAEFRGVRFRLADPVTVQNGQVRGGSVFPAGREESEDVFQFVRDNPGDFGIEVNDLNWVACEDYSNGRPWMALICRGCSSPETSARIITRPETINPVYQVELRDHQVQVREFVYRFLIGQCVNCRTVHHTTPTRQYAPTSPAYR